ncbi:MAG TPA: sigma-70 family RNA polymerase sigma factor [Gaiellaceae bacterium]|nr:sigma-70 family RNA polymerase sigma factor [Gaiellaceae bacterium]
MAAADETQALWQEYRRTRDQHVRDRLILNYAPLVKFVAGRVRASLPSHVDEQDLVSYGLLGLIGAIKRYDPDREIKFETYAMARIRGAIIDELRSLIEDNRLVVVDVSRAVFLDSSVAHALFAAQRVADERGTAIRVQLGDNPTVARMFEVLGVTEAMACFETRDEALAAA